MLMIYKVFGVVFVLALCFNVYSLPLSSKNHWNSFSSVRQDEVDPTQNISNMNPELPISTLIPFAPESPRPLLDNLPALNTPQPINDSSPVLDTPQPINDADLQQNITRIQPIGASI
mmetsp:Transcript_11933/g.21614  ORF Transcript_11933/g.21614 Transcript_11933/m.21614 type:complete len:117 (+) Transcript_11933:1177-1527(+)